MTQFQSHLGLISFRTHVTTLMDASNFNPTLVWFLFPHFPYRTAIHLHFNPTLVWFLSERVETADRPACHFNPTLVWFLFWSKTSNDVHLYVEFQSHLGLISFCERKVSDIEDQTFQSHLGLISLRWDARLLADKTLFQSHLGLISLVFEQEVAVSTSKFQSHLGLISLVMLSWGKPARSCISIPPWSDFFWSSTGRPHKSQHISIPPWSDFFLSLWTSWTPVVSHFNPTLVWFLSRRARKPARRELAFQSHLGLISFCSSSSSCSCSSSISIPPWSDFFRGYEWEPRVRRPNFNPTLVWFLSCYSAWRRRSKCISIPPWSDFFEEKQRGNP